MNHATGEKVDKVFLRDLRVETVIGIFEWERHATQTVSLDLIMAADIRRAAESDDVSDALNYKDVAKRVIELTEASRFQLIESLAELIARTVVTEFAVPWVSVSVAKPGAIEHSREVGVVIEREAGDYA